MAWNWVLILENCTGCGICADVCPAGAIRMTRDMPYPRAVQGRCIGCMDCLKECPFGAIDIYQEPATQTEKA